MRRVPLVLLCSLAVAPLAAQVPFAEYASRRDSLAATMSDGVLIALGGHEPAEDFLAFYPSPSFYYLTGVTEPDAVLIVVKRTKAVAMTLFVQPRDPGREAWTGTRLGAEGMKRATGIPSRTLNQLRPTLDSLLAPGGTLSVVGDLSGSGYTTRDSSIVNWYRQTTPTTR